MAKYIEKIKFSELLKEEQESIIQAKKELENGETKKSDILK